MPEKATATSPRIGDLTKRLQREPGSRVFFDLAREHHSAGNLEEAFKLCRDGLLKHPSYHSARVLLGRVLIDRGQFSDARPELERVVKQAPDNLLARRLLAEALAGGKDLHGALGMLRSLLALHPGDPEAVQRIQELEAEAAEAEAAGMETLPSTKAEPPATEEVSEVPAVEEPGNGQAATVLMSAPPVFTEAPAPPPETAPAPSVGMEEEAVPAPSYEVTTVTFKYEPPVTPAPPVEALSPAGSDGIDAAPIEPPPVGAAAAAAEREPEAPEEGLGEARPPGASVATVMMSAADFASRAAGTAPPLLSVAPQAAADAGEGAVPAVADKPKPPPGDEDEPTVGALPTPTLAEIYLAQGMPERALEIYKQVLVGDPHNQEAQARVRELSDRLTPPGSLTQRKIEVLEGWLERIRRHHHVQDDAGRGGPTSAGM